jgi:1-acyl-sn-glycerol-3-phosphate acyltransferase
MPVTKYTIHHVLGHATARLIAAFLLCDATVEGAEHLNQLPRPYVIAMNHCSHADPVLMWSAFPDYCNFMVKEELHKIPFFGPMSELTGNIPLKRSGNDIQAMKSALKLMKAGINLAFFVEGTRSEDGIIKPFKEGALTIAAKMRCPIVPVYLHGTYTILKKGSFFPKSHPTSVHILKPFMDAVEQNLSKDELNDLNQRLYEEMRDKQRSLLQYS